MMVVVVYDIATGEPDGRKRLRKVARKCADFGVPIQDSVYECELDAEQYRRFREDLEVLILPESDSICFYLLGNRYRSRIERVGKERVQWNRETYVI